MATYRLAFFGRKIGALGLNGAQCFDVEADSFEQAAFKAYDTHEHITHPLAVENRETGEKRMVSP